MKLVVAVTAAHASRYIGQFLLLLVASRIGATDGVADVVLAFAITTPIFIVAGLGYRTLILTHRVAFSLRSLVVVRAGGAIVATMVSWLIATLLTSDQVTTVVLLITLLKSGDLFQELWSTLLQRDKRLALLVTTSFGGAAAIAASMLLTAYMSRNLEATIAAAATANLAASAIGAWLYRNRVPHVVDGTMSEVVAVLRAGVPLSLSYAVVGVIVNVPQYMTAAFGSTADTAQVGIFLYLVIVGDMVANPVAQAWIHRALLHREDASAFGRWYLGEAIRAFGIGIGPAAAIAGIGWLALPIVFGPEYRMTVAEALLVMASIACLPAIYLGGAALGVLNRYVSSLVVTLPALGISISVGFALVPHLGVSGALTALLAGYVARALLPLPIILRRKLN